MTRTVILGAGALGLTAGLRLAQRGDEVTVIEREPLPGGLAAGFEIASGIWLDRFYHHLFRGDRHAISLISELGLADELVWRRPRTVTLRDGRPWQLDSAPSLLRFDPLPMHDRVRMGLALAYLRLLGAPERLEGQTAADWIRRRMGPRSFDVVWGPLFRGKFGEHAELIALPWFWARVHDRSAELGYLRGSFQALYRRLVLEIERRGGRVLLGREVREIATAQAGGLIVRHSAPVSREDAAERTDRVISTLAPALTSQLAPELPEEFRSRYGRVPAFGAHCLILALDRPLTDAYWMNVNDPGYPFLTLVEHTNYMDAEDYGGRHLVYLGNYRPMDDPIFRASTAEVLSEFAPHLRRINPSFQPAWITSSWSFAAPFAQPIVGLEYRRSIPPFDTPIPGLHIANMFQVYPHDRGQNYSIALADQVAAHVRRQSA